MRRRTNLSETTLAASDVVRAYKSLSQAERAFRSKSPFHIRIIQRDQGFMSPTRRNFGLASLASVERGDLYVPSSKSSGSTPVPRWSWNLARRCFARPRSAIGRRAS